MCVCFWVCAGIYIGQNYEIPPIETVIKERLRRFRALVDENLDNWEIGREKKKLTQSFYQ